MFASTSNECLQYVRYVKQNYNCSPCNGWRFRLNSCYHQDKSCQLSPLIQYFFLQFGSVSVFPFKYVALLNHHWLSNTIIKETDTYIVYFASLFYGLILCIFLYGTLPTMLFFRRLLQSKLQDKWWLNNI